MAVTETTCPLCSFCSWSCDGAASVHTNLYCLESAELKVYYILDATVIIEMLLYSNVSVAVLYVSYILVDF